MSDGKIIKVIFFGDIVGKPGRVAVRDFLQNNDTFKNYDFIINNHVIIHCIYLTIQNKKAYSASVF